MIKYPFIRTFHPEMLERRSGTTGCSSCCCRPGAMGLISVVLWDTLFPARRDAFVLTPMPIPLSASRCSAASPGSCLLFAGFTVALNAIPAVTFPFVASGAFLEMPRAMLGHIVAATARPTRSSSSA